MSNKISSSKKNYKYFIGFINDYKIKQLRTILPKMSRYLKSYDGGIKWICFSIEGDYFTKL